MYIMANICITEIYIDGKQEKIDKLADFIEKYMEQTKPSDNILKIMLNKLGINPKKYNCAMLIDYWAKPKKGTLFISAISKWGPNVKALNEIAKHFDPNCNLYFYAEEPSMDIFLSNDKESKYFNKYKLETEIIKDFVSKEEEDKFNSVFSVGDQYISKEKLTEKLDKFLGMKDLGFEEAKAICDADYWFENSHGIEIIIRETEYIDLDSPYID